MIHNFVFAGDFQDPHKEFFISKKFRKGIDKDSGSSEFLFKLTSKPHVKIPVFLIESASTIYKAGSALHLLRKQGLKSNAENLSLKQYYEICQSGISQMFIPKQILSQYTYEAPTLQLEF